MSILRARVELISRSAPGLKPELISAPSSLCAHNHDHINTHKLPTEIANLSQSIGSLSRIFFYTNTYYTIKTWLSHDRGRSLATL